MFSIITKLPYSAYQSCLKTILSCTRAFQNSSLEASLVYIRSTDVNKISQYYLRWNKNHPYCRTVTDLQSQLSARTARTDRQPSLRSVNGACISLSQQNTVCRFVRSVCLSYTERTSSLHLNITTEHAHSVTLRTI